MVFKKITENVEVHQTLPDNPNLSTTDLKKKWDEGARIIKSHFNELIDELNNNLFPIGYRMFVNNNVDYSNYLGFKWEKVSIGRVPVGRDETQTEFATLGQQGGSKYTERHTHGNISDNNPTSKALYDRNALDGGGSVMFATANSVTTSISEGEYIRYFGTGNSGNLQPYEVVNIWERKE